jgi:hypothetical protein
VLYLLSELYEINMLIIVVITIVISL